MPHKLTRIHVVLFVLTFFSTVLAGAYFGYQVVPWKNPEKIYLGLPFSITLLLILLTHELSHYFISRRHNISVTLPYFIPAPTIFGTFGAIIKMKPPIPDRRSLLDIGASGPLCGFIVAIIAVIIGLKLSKVIPLDNIHDHPAEMYVGSSLVFYYLSHIILNVKISAYAIDLHPIAFAGWVGLLVTSLNLLPIGQLDGGHIVYALFGEKHKLIAKITLSVLIILGIVFWPGWLIWAVLMIIIGYKHPPVVYPYTTLDKKRKIIGYFSFITFIVTFIPVPIQII